ncbi:autotransporter domain-containing protein [Selenomonas sp. TAMA-11512]|uniref:autotransporter outer membrane beta-barrel domain-containing protein n=1 Tax=Selenomonas sp. TAMA-11512 TaxID=3095337 RepID=UPI00308E1D00|nr:autotransporter domain-containing protein [Selenomonas sp. TAMA-11512]
MKCQFHRKNLKRQDRMAQLDEGDVKEGQNVRAVDVYACSLRSELSPPPRTLVPRILAVLTAGAVTLGAYPCAHADPIVRSSVTEDIDAPEGVAGSIDGSAATITIGTEGGGTSPEIKHGSGFTSVYGSRYRGAAPSFTLQGGRAVIRSGRMRQVYGGNARVRTRDYADASVQVTGSSVTLAGGNTGDVIGGYASAETDWGAAYAAARGNVVHLQGGTHANVYGGVAETRSHAVSSTAIAEGNTVYISGGTYLGSEITAGWAKRPDPGTSIARNNTIEITGAPGPLPSLIGGRGGVGSGRNILENNALIVRYTKGITAASAEGFQRFVFYAPADLAAGEPMLSLTFAAQDVKLEGAAVEAYMPGSSTAHELTLLRTAAHITTDAATKMTVYEGISGTLANAMYVDSTGKKLLVRRDGAFQLNEDNAKSLAETMAGSAAFLGTGANLFTDRGLASASAEAAGASGFAPFAALGGSSMRHETGSHVEMKGTNLAVGFSRELKRGSDRLLFGPLVEYGHGSYDSYVNAVHGDGTVRYIGAGGFLRKEQANGMFYEGSLRFGRSDMDYAADMPVGSTTIHTSYDTDANYIGAHLGIGQQVTAKSGTNREIYLRYFYTRQNEASATLSTGDRYDFAAVDSHRLRTGVRWTIPQKDGSLILGTSVQYEFGGDTSATYHRPGGLSYTSPSPSLKGFSGSLEVGWKAAMSENATANVAIEGWMGKQRGVSLKAGFEWKF